MYYTTENEKYCKYGIVILEVYDEILKEAIKEKTTNQTSLICDLLNEGRYNL